MTKYELILIVPGKVSDKEIPQVSEKIALILEKQGAKIFEEDNLGRKKLSYPIKKNEIGTYLLYRFSGNNQIAEKLEKIFKLTSEIIRYLIIINPPVIEKKVEKAPIVKSGVSEVKKAPEVKEKRKINLEDLEEKLDNILDDGILK